MPRAPRAWLVRLAEADPALRLEVIIALLRAAVAALGAASLTFLVRANEGNADLRTGALVLASLAVLSLASTIALVRAAGWRGAHRLPALLTGGELVVFLGYAAYFADRPGAGSALPALLVVLGPVRWGWRGAGYAAVPVGIIASIWPQHSLTGTTYSTGQVWSLIALLAASSTAVATLSRRAGTRLRQAQKQFQVAFEHAPTGMALLDDLGRVLRANRALADLIGREPAALHGHLLSELVLGPESFDLRVLLARLSDDLPAARLEVQLGRTDHDLRWGLLIASWLGAAEGSASSARVIVQVEDITERKEVEVKMAYLADHDHLTGLPNRALLRRSLTDALASGGRLGLLYLDLDRFKTVNDGMGHAAGDAVLVAVAGRLSAVLRPGDVLARIGGDEFVMLCQHIAHPEDLLRIGSRVLDVMRQAVALEESGVLSMTTSVGAVVSTPGCTEDSLLRDADVAMYAAKAAGGNRVQLYSQTLHRTQEHARELEVGLHQALGHDQLSLAYQPVVDLATGQVASLEALARWSHPVWGEIAPTEFIAIAERSELIVSLGAWVLRQALTDAATWPDVAGRPPGVAVNISGRQLMDPGFPGLVGGLLAETGVAGGRLCLEITETALIGDVGSVVEALRALRALGVRVAIDDFGTGHASLSYLTQFPVDTVKIDRSFVTGVATEAGSAAIVGGVVAMAHAFGLRVVAEGAETHEQLSQLRRLGCEYAQGFVLSPPLPTLAVPVALGLAVPVQPKVPAPRAEQPAAGLEEARRYRLLLDSARDISACLDLGAVLDRAFAALREVISFTGGSLQLVDGDVLRLAVTEPPAPPEHLAATLPLGQGIGGAIAVTGEPRYLPDITVVRAVSAAAPSAGGAVVSDGVRSWYGVPLVAEGGIIGVLQIDSTEVDAFDDRDQLLVLSFASVVAAAVQTARAFAGDRADLPVTT